MAPQDDRLDTDHPSSHEPLPQPDAPSPTRRSFTIKSEEPDNVPTTMTSQEVLLAQPRARPETVTTSVTTLRPCRVCGRTINRTDACRRYEPDVPSTSTNHSHRSGRGTSRTTRTVGVLDVADLAALPCGRAVVLAFGLRPALFSHMCRGCRGRQAPPSPPASARTTRRPAPRVLRPAHRCPPSSRRSWAREIDTPAVDEPPGPKECTSTTRRNQGFDIGRMSITMRACARAPTSFGELVAPVRQGVTRPRAGQTAISSGVTSDQQHVRPMVASRCLTGHAGAAAIDFKSQVRSDGC